MNDSSNSFDLGFLIEMVKRRKSSFLIYSTAIFVLGLTISWTLPSTYRAETTVLIERQIPADIVSTTITGNVQERLQILQQRALTRENLLIFARDMGILSSPDGLSPDEVVEAEDEALEDILSSVYLDLVDVKVTEDRSGRTSNVVVSFVVAYESYDPVSAATFANEITQLLLKENQSLRSEQSEQVTTFLAQAQDRLKSEVLLIEKDISRLSEENYDLLPEQLDVTRKEIAQRQGELVTVNGEIGFLESQQSQYSSRLKSTPKHVVSERTGVAASQDPQVRLQQAKLDLKVALQSFTESHPDVVRLKQLISDLEREVLASGAGSVADEGLIMPSNPEYMAILQQLNDVEAKLESAKARKVQIESFIVENQSKVRSDPAVELKYNQLLRDLERAQTEYADIKSRLYQAQLAQSLEQEQKGERFTLLSSAIAPREAISPNRVALSILSLVLALGAGLARAFFAEMRDNTLKNLNDVVSATGMKPLAVIPAIDLTNL